MTCPQAYIWDRVAEDYPLNAIIPSLWTGLNNNEHKNDNVDATRSINATVISVSDAISKCRTCNKQTGRAGDLLGGFFGEHFTERVDF